jgi:protein CpxP
MKRLDLIVAIVIPIVVIAWALPSNAHRGKRGWKARKSPMAALELSAEQRTKLESFKLERAKQMAQLRADLKVARLDLQAAMRQDEPNPAEVKTRVAAVNNARSLILESRVNHRLKVNSVLTPEQRNKLREMRRDRSQGGWGKMWRKGRYQKRLRGMGHPRPDRIDEGPSSI